MADVNRDGFGSSLLGTGATWRMEDEDGVRWETVGLETVECEIGVTVWPGATMFRAIESQFEA